MAEKVQGFVSLLGGMNAGINPMLLPNEQYAFGINVTSRSGKIHTRPPFVKVDLNYGDLEARFAGAFQGCASYRRNSNDYLIVVINGRVLGINTSTFETIDYSEYCGLLMNPDVKRCYFCQAERYMIVQDGIGVPMIIDGLTSRLANQEAGEVPTGTLMAYGHGRLFIVPRMVDAEDGRRFFIAGDILMPNNSASILSFTENTYMATGGAFSLPSEMGFIKGMAFLQNVSSGTGFGALIVFAQNGASAFAVNAPRSTWPDIDISQVLFRDAGTRSSNAIVQINNDIYFRGLDGIRSLTYTVASIKEGSEGIRNRPISRELGTLLDADGYYDLRYIEMAYVNNRLFCMTNRMSDAEPMFGMLAVIDADVSSSINSSMPPIYDGVWTGLRFMSLNKARHPVLKREVLFVWAKGNARENLLYFLDERGYAAQYSDGIQSVLYTKSMTFDDMITQKKILSAQLDLSGISGQINLWGYFKPYGYPFYGSFANGVIAYANPAGAMQSRQSIKMIPIGDYGNLVTKVRLDHGRAFDFVFAWRGHLSIESAFFNAQTFLEPVVVQNEYAAPLTSPEGGIDVSPELFQEAVLDPDYVLEDEDEGQTIVYIPDIPLHVTATNTVDGVQLTWDWVRNSAQYIVSWSNFPGGPYLNPREVASLSFLDTTILVGETRYYVVQVRNEAGTSPYSAEVSGTKNPAVPAAPSYSLATIGEKEITNTWSAVPLATTYTLKMWTSVMGSWANGTIIANNTAALSATAANLTPPLLYFFQMQAHNISGSSPLSNVWSRTARTYAITGLTIDNVGKTIWPTPYTRLTSIDVQPRLVTGQFLYLFLRCYAGNPITAFNYLGVWDTYNQWWSAPNFFEKINSAGSNRGYYMFVSTDGVEPGIYQQSGYI